MFFYITAGSFSSRERGGGGGGGKVFLSPTGAGGGGCEPTVIPTLWMAAMLCGDGLYTKTVMV
jgi:hypothetical protein